MRLVFLILVFCNLVFFVWSQGYLGGRDAGHEPQRLGNQLQPEKIRLVTETTQPAERTTCKKISGLTLSGAEALKATLSSVAGWTLAVTAAPRTVEHWVMIPGLANGPAAEKKLAEVRRLGGTDAQVIQDENNGPFVVSLGVFRSTQRAQEFFDAAGKMGIRSAKLVERQSPATANAEVRAPAGDLARRLDEFLAPYPAASATDCDPS